MKKLLLTGGNGFIGKNLQEAWQNKYALSAPSRAVVELTDSSAVNQYMLDKQFDYIIHAASIGVNRKSIIDPTSGLNANLRAFTNIFRHQPHCKKLISLGSGAEYGRPLSHRQIEESQLGKNIPEDPYGYAKLLCSKITSTVSPDKAVTLNLFGVFGPHEDYQTRFISYAIVRSLFGLPIVINQNVEFDYVYINDLIHIIDYFIEHEAVYSNYNVTTGIPVTLVEIAEIILEIMGNKHDIEIKQHGMGNAYTGSNERLTHFLEGSFAFTPLKQAIAELIIWYENKIHLLDKELVI